MELQKCAKCKRNATTKNYIYFPDEWLCTFHANKATLKGRIERKLNKKKKSWMNEITKP